MKTDLHENLVLQAYAQGIFPMWDEASQETHWYLPKQRGIFPLNAFHISKSLKRFLNQKIFSVNYDTLFLDVMKSCADRKEGTWIGPDFYRVYGNLFKLGHAHSVEILDAEGGLVGGTYGVSLGGAFFAESMFHRKTNASKLALLSLIQKLNELGYVLLDVQYLTPHLASLGAIEISQEKYESLLGKALTVKTKAWR